MPFQKITNFFLIKRYQPVRRQKCPYLLKVFPPYKNMFFSAHYKPTKISIMYNGLPFHTEFQEFTSLERSGIEKKIILLGDFIDIIPENTYVCKGKIICLALEGF